MEKKRAWNNDGDLSLGSVGRRCTGESHEKRQSGILSRSVIRVKEGGSLE